MWTTNENCQHKLIQGFKSVWQSLIENKYQRKKVHTCMTHMIHMWEHLVTFFFLILNTDIWDREVFRTKKIITLILIDKFILRDSLKLQSFTTILEKPLKTFLDFLATQSLIIVLRKDCDRHILKLVHNLILQLFKFHFNNIPPITIIFLQYICPLSFQDYNTASFSHRL
jgi:hypothetical protein